MLDKDFSRKAYEIAYALCRIGDNLSDPFGPLFLDYGSQILAASVAGEFQKSFDLIEAVRYFVNLALGTGRLSESNANLLLSQFSEFQPMALGLSGSAPVKVDLDLSDIFSAQNFKASEVQVKSEKISGNARESFVVEEPIIYPAMRENLQDEFPRQNNLISDEPSEPVSISSSLRQSEILNHIRQSGNCRMKDLQDMFPRCSERTLRYDIEALIARRVIERVGAGSATSYRPLITNA